MAKLKCLAKYLILYYTHYFRWVLEEYSNPYGNMVARANITAIPYVNSGTLTCKATGTGVSVTKSITVTVLCRKCI